jgi:hypothetical protein
MKIYTTALVVQGDSAVSLCDTIFYEGKFWLVNTWLHLRERPVQVPERIVCLSDLPHQKSGSPSRDFVLNDPIPIAVFDVQNPPQSISGYTVIDCPEIEYPTGRA